MSCFPFFINIEGKKILVVGGGKVALRKVEKLLPFKPEITVVSPYICDELSAFGVDFIRREFADGDVDGKFCVISATDDEAVNSRVYRLCTERGILINTVDDKEKCSFIFPALSGSGDITVGISTSGKSPAYARFLRESVDRMLDERMLEIADILGKYRPVIKSGFDGFEARREVNAALLKMCLESEKIPDENEINDMLGRMKKIYEN